MTPDPSVLNFGRRFKHVTVRVEFNGRATDYRVYFAGVYISTEFSVSAAEDTAERIEAGARELVKRSKAKGKGAK